MGLLVPTTPLPATEFCHIFSLLLNFVYVTLFYSLFIILSSPITLSQSNLRLANVTFALAKRSICLTFPPLLCIVHHLSIVAEEIQCAPSGLQISGEAFRAWSLAQLPKHMNHWLLFILQLESTHCDDRSFWNIIKMGPMKPIDFKTRHAFLLALIIKL